MNAPRAFPIVSGPVGLAETNSTLTLRGPVGRDPPPGIGLVEDAVDRRPPGRRAAAGCS